jgi:hypothetical protein
LDWRDNPDSGVSRLARTPDFLFEDHFDPISYSRIGGEEPAGDEGIDGREVLRPLYASPTVLEIFGDAV